MLYVSSGLSEDSIEVANCMDLISGSSDSWKILNVRYCADHHVFSPISSTEILIMHKKDVSIFDTKSNTIKKAGTSQHMLECKYNQFAMNRDGQVVALV